MPRLQARATYDDLLKVPENMIAELIDGEVVASRRPSPPLAAVVARNLQHG
jgi:hypothetical protein